MVCRSGGCFPLLNRLDGVRVALRGDLGAVHAAHRGAQRAVEPGGRPFRQLLDCLLFARREGLEQGSGGLTAVSVISQPVVLVLCSGSLHPLGGCRGGLSSFVRRQILPQSTERLNVEIGPAGGVQRKIEEGRSLLDRDLGQELLGGLHVFGVDEGDRRHLVPGALLGKQVGELEGIAGLTLVRLELRRGSRCGHGGGRSGRNRR